MNKVLCIYQMTKEETNKRKFMERQKSKITNQLGIRNKEKSKKDIKQHSRMEWQQDKIDKKVQFMNYSRKKVQCNEKYYLGKNLIKCYGKGIKEETFVVLS